MWEKSAMTASPLLIHVTSARKAGPRRRMGPVAGYSLAVLLSTAFWAMLLVIIF